MARFNRSKRPIRSIKNIIDGEGNILAATAAEQQIATTVNTYTGAVTETTVGSSINAFYVSVFMLNDVDQAAGSLNWYIAKRHAGQTFASFPSPGAVGGSTVRNQIFHMEKGLAGNIADGGSTMVFKGVIKVPRGQQRMREGDIWFIAIENIQAGKFCIQAIYKWYT